MLDSALPLIVDWVTRAISAAGYAGITGLMALESACVPLPSEIIMPFAGYLASTGRFSLMLAATAGAAGCNLGSAVAYAAASRGGRPLVERWGRFLLLDPADLDRAERFFRRFGGGAVLVGRLLPVVRTFVAVPAGIARMPLVPFHAYTFLGSWPWCFGLAWVGRALGERWQTDPALRAVIHRLDLLVVLVAASGAAWMIWRRVGAGRPGRS